MGHSLDIDTSPPKFDFDDWSRLCSKDPDQFEQLRQYAIARFLEARSNDCRLLRLQCRIDLERRRARTPLKACLKLSAMMWNRFHDLHEALNKWDGDARGLPGVPAAMPRVGARILPFRRPAAPAGEGHVRRDAPC